MENYRQLLVKYVQNECNKEELDAILLWLSDASNKEKFEAFITEDWNGNEVNPVKETNIKASFASLEQRLTDDKIRELPQRTKERKRVIGIMARYAAVLLLSTGIGYLTFYVAGHQRNEPVSMNRITVPLGSKIKVELGDGSKVWLNSGSTLSYPQRFSGEYREITLSGEAFFDVVKNPQKPFVVRTAELNIKVLGTVFNVKAYPEEGTIETTLVRGMVTITKSNKSLDSKDAIYLKPNQRATYVKEQGKLFLADTEKKFLKEELKEEKVKKREEKIIFTKNVDTEQYTAWKDDKLIFKNEGFENLCTRLKRWYGVEINIRSEDLKKYHYTGILQKETINDVIEILRLTMPFQYEINHNVVDIWSLNDKTP